MQENITIQVLSLPQNEFFKVSITTVIASITTLITVFILYQQYQVNKNKLKFDLFEKRVKFFVALQDFLTIVLLKLNLFDTIISQFKEKDNNVSYCTRLEDYKQVFINYQKDIYISEFLFDENIHSYLLEIESKGKEFLSPPQNEF